MSLTTDQLEKYCDAQDTKINELETIVFAQALVIAALAKFVGTSWAEQFPIEAAMLEDLMPLSSDEG